MSSTGLYPNTRLRRLRGSATIRALVEERGVNVSKLVLPLFIKHGANIKNPISSMPGHFQLSIDKLEDEIKEICDLGIQQILLFGIPDSKDPEGSLGFSDQGIIQRAIPVIKSLAPNLLIMTDICCCEYTDHGHCGVLIPDSSDANVLVDNDKTLELLTLQAVSHAKAGADIVAPSANMDGMVQAIRKGLDQAGFQHIPILSYSVKYASSLYGPFRQAAEGAPKLGDRRSYQMNYANAFEALHECALDIAEGADMLMVKPAHTYLDIIFKIKNKYPYLPLAAYHTSGEFAMIKAAAEKGWIDEKNCVLEVLTAIHRAGADFIITYYTKEVAAWLK
jgi:porphobilinogen synthase